MDQPTLLQLCERLSRGEAEAQRVLMPWTSDTKGVPDLLALLVSDVPIGVWFACHALSSLMLQKPKEFDPSLLKRIISTVSQSLLQRNKEYFKDQSGTSRGLVNAMATVFARAVRLSCLSTSTQGPLTNAIAVIEKDCTDTARISVQFAVYIALVQEMQVSSQIPQSRRVATAFRDKSLYTMFKAAVKTLHQLELGSIPPDAFTDALLNNCLVLINSCFGFSFSGIPASEDNDDSEIIMVPPSWFVIRDENLWQLLFQVYYSCASDKKVESAKLTLQALVFLGTIRRAFHISHMDVQFFVSVMISGSLRVIQEGSVMTNCPECLHEFCRLLAKFNSAYRGSDLLNNADYPVWVEAVAGFTLNVMKTSSVAANSKRYLLSFWGTTASTLTNHANVDLPVRAEVAKFIVDVTWMFFNERLELFEYCGGMDELEDELLGAVTEAEDTVFVTNTVTVDCSAVVKILCDHLQVVMGQSMTPVNGVRLGWLIKMAGAALLGMHDMSVTAASSAVNTITRRHVEGLRLARVYVAASELAGQAMRASFVSATGHAVDSAALRFFECLSRFVFQEAAHAHLAEEGAPALTDFCLSVELTSGLGIPPMPRQGTDRDSHFLLSYREDEVRVSAERIVSMMAQKLLTLLDQCHDQDELASQCLALLSLWAQNMPLINCGALYSTGDAETLVWGKVLLSVPSFVKFLASGEFANLKILTSSHGKLRSSIYETITRLFVLNVLSAQQTGVPLTLELPDNIEAYLAPFLGSIDQLWPDNLNSATPSLLIALFLNWRGIVKAVSDCTAYTKLLMCLMNQNKSHHTSRLWVFVGVLRTVRDPTVILACLRTASALLANHADRLRVLRSDQYGPLLFRFAVEVLMAYCSAPVPDVPPEKRYAAHYKPLATALSLFNCALKGDLVSGATFDVYRDESLAAAISAAYQAVMGIPEEELQGLHHKLFAVYEFLAIVTERFMPVLMLFPPEHLANLIQILRSGLLSFEQDVRRFSYEAVYHLGRFLFVRLHPNAPPPANYAEFHFGVPQEDLAQREKIVAWLSAHRVFVGQLQSTMITMLMENQSPSCWLLARALLSVILLDMQGFESLSHEMASSYGDRDERVRQLFGDLVGNIENNLGLDNTELFAMNVHAFAQRFGSLK